ncbi:ApeA N-terminal domain 1-containing protein [Streptomyces sp. CLCI03]
MGCSTDSGQPSGCRKASGSDQYLGTRSATSRFGPNLSATGHDQNCGGTVARDAKHESVVSDWWLPGGEPGDGTPGTYSILPTGSSLIRLHRALGGEEDFFSDAATLHPIVHGMVFGKPVTLVDVRTAKWRWGMGTQADIELRPRLALEGLLLDEGELRLTEARVRIQGQDDWILSPGIITKRSTDGFVETVTIPRLQEKVSWVTGGCATIRDATEWSANGAEASISRKTEFHFLFENPIPLADFFETQLRGLQVLMTMIRGERCGIESLHFTDSTWEINGEVSARPHWVTARLRAPESMTRKRWGDLLLPYELFDWESQAPAVFDVSAGWAYAIEQWALLLDGRFIWPVARFSTAASAVEALDRILNPPAKAYAPDEQLIERVKEELQKTDLEKKVRKRILSDLKRPTEATLDQRMERLANIAPAAMKEVIDQPSWARRTARLRNVASHGLDSSKEFSRDTRALECGSEILLHLLECAFLYHLGFTPDQIHKIKSGHPGTWQRKQIVDECFNLLPEIPGQAAVVNLLKAGSGDSN